MKMGSQTVKLVMLEDVGSLGLWLARNMHVTDVLGAVQKGLITFGCPRNDVLHVISTVTKMLSEGPG